MSKKTWKKIIELAIVFLTALGGFLGGQASARNNVVNLFDNQTQIEYNGTQSI